jgi:hypothetical protein
MRIKQAIFAGILAMLSTLRGVSSTLAVDVDNIFLGSNDLPPLDLVLQVTWQRHP